jgi:hypothetical protein
MMNNDIENPKTKLSQNIHSLIGEIGEKQVLLRLSFLVHQTDWRVFHNLGEAGYDILLMNVKTNERIRIEVKTRQKLQTTGKIKNRIQFFMSDGEYHSCDFLVAYHLDSNGFFIVPKSDLKSTKGSERVRWRFSLALMQNGEYSQRFEKYLNTWHTLHPDFAR